MTLRNLWGKLRKRNKEDYRQFQFSTAFAVMLISSFLMLVCSPLIQGALPEGGDSGKQVWMSFGVSAIGCIVFVLYVTKLFLRYKSREIGIFLALGAEKHILKRSLAGELARMTAVCSAAGILLGAVIAFITGNIIKVLIAGVYDGDFSFTVSGLLFSVCYALILFLFIQFQAGRAMKRTNVIEVINEQRRQEPMKKSVSKAYLISGIALTLAGIFGALILPQIVAYTAGIFLGSWTNAFYLAAVFGVYRVLVYAVSSHQKGRNPQKYYNNLIDYGMMKFQGASVVRNMLVITLLLFGGLYAASYLPTMLTGSSSEQGYEAEYSYRYLNDADEPSESMVKDLARKYGLTVENYREGDFLRVFGSGTERDADENNQLVETYYDRFAQYDVTSAAEFEELTGISLDIPDGAYYQIIGSTSYENIWNHFGDMDQLYIESEDAYLPLSYVDTVSYESLNISGDNNMGDASRFVVSDADFARLKTGLSDDSLETQVLFDTDGASLDEIAFSNELFRTLAEGMSENMDVLTYYNAASAERNGSEYTETFAGAAVDPENPLKAADWQFAPHLVPLLDQQMLMALAARLLSFSYIFIICIAAAGVIGYTRSQSVGLTNRQVFEDIRRLGADRQYRRTLMRRQLRKIFVLPTILSTGVCLLYEVLILWNNDGQISAGEIRSLLIIALIAAAAAVYQFTIYRLSVRKTGKLLKL